MIEALWNNAEWLLGFVALVPYLARFSAFVKLLGILGPFGQVVKVALEFAAEFISTIVTWFLKSIWYCFFNPATWAAVLLAYFIGSAAPVQNVRVSVGVKKPVAAARVAPQRRAVSRTYRRQPSAASVRSITHSNFSTH